jgi:nicotinamide mononucleotide transporter
MIISNWLSSNYIEVFGAVTGIIYVFLEIRQTIWLWPVGIITSAVYIWVFFTSKLYADMSLQGYYLIISCMGWYWWLKGTNHIEKGNNSPLEGGQGDVKLDFRTDNVTLQVTRLKLRTGILLALVFISLYSVLWIILSHFTDSPVPEWDSFLTSLSIVATWMLARKIYEHWFLWIAVDSVAAILFITRGLYPTVILYTIYCIMSLAGLLAWKKTIHH